MKPRFATAWLGGCSGCHMSFLDLDQCLIHLASLVDICYTPIADIKEFPENVDITLVEGAVANEDHVRDLRLIRARTRTLVAFGDCAVTGNVTALRNTFALNDVLGRAYREAAFAGGVPPDGEIVPRLLDRVLRVHDVVHADYFLLGCPPSAQAIHEFVADLLAGRAPGAGRFGT
jgi:NAD-reducing hydrogenase small subunit